MTAAAADPPSSTPVGYQFLRPAVDIRFWSDLRTHKLEVARLDTSPLPLGPLVARPGSNEVRVVGPVGTSTGLSLESQGWVVVTNTAEDWDGTGRCNLDRAALLEKTVEPLRRGEDWRPRILVTAFLDLKNYSARYNVAFPVLKCEGHTVTFNTLPQTDWPVFAGKVSDILQPRVLFPSGGTADLSVGTSLDDVAGVLVPDFCSAGEGGVGWCLQNVVPMLLKKWPTLVGRGIRVGCCRESGSNSSLVWTELRVPAGVSTDLGAWKVRPGWVLFENKIPAQKVDLRDFLDPSQVASKAVDLNVSLMQWRLVPALQPQVMRGLRCLLFGAGTLGCAVARCLLAWGVRGITFVDSGTVSHSNPARQSLFTFQDACESRPKAECAAQRLKDILPSCDARGERVEIPMPGHAPREDFEQVYSQLEGLVDCHDVVFLLTDTRESRWLPSLLAAKKICICVALGFDQYVVQYHRIGQAACYFCNDLNAPSDTTRFRTVDMQCTVTRPGLAGMSAGVAVELLAARTQKPGVLEYAQGPDQIRGYLSPWSVVPSTTEKFPQCICCSDAIRQEFERRGRDFVREVCADSSILESLSGLTSMKDNLASGAQDLLVCDSFDEISD